LQRLASRKAGTALRIPMPSAARSTLTAPKLEKAVRASELVDADATMMLAQS
jgi:hypothetical protein